MADKLRNLSYSSGRKRSIWYLYSTKAFSSGHCQRQDTGLDGSWAEPLLGLTNEEIQGKSQAHRKVPLGLV